MNEYVIDKKQVRRTFSRAARDYDATAVLQREVCQRMLERLDYIRLQPERVLDAGCGTGWGSRQLSQRYPDAQIIALDMALGMLTVAREQSGWWQKIFSRNRQSPICADIEALPLASSSVEMVWSNLTLQWCNDLPATFSELHRVLRAEGLLIFSSFGPDTLKELRSAFLDVDGNSHISRFTDMHDFGDMLTSSGFSDPVMDMEMMTLTYGDVKAVMQDLRGIGAANATAGRGQGLMGKGTWQQVLQRYEKFRTDGKLPATFEIVYGHAWKPRLKQTPEGLAIIQTPFKL